MSAKEEAFERNNQKPRARAYSPSHNKLHQYGVTESVQPAKAHGTAFLGLMMTKHLSHALLFSDAGKGADAATLERTVQEEVDAYKHCVNAHLDRLEERVGALQVNSV